MNYHQLIDTIASLPQEKQNEVFDFVSYLAERFASKKNSVTEWRDGEFNQFSMEQAMRGMEEEEPLYNEADMKERWQ